MDETIERIDISITADAGSAIKGIQSLSASLRELKNCTESLRGINLKGKFSFSGSGFFSNNLLSTLKTFGILRSARSIINGINKALVEGRDNLYQYSKAMSGDFAATMDRLATSSLYLKNSLGAAVAPLIESFAPVLETIGQKIADLFDKAAQLIALLRGKSSWTRAVKVQTQYAEAAGAAAEATNEMKRSLMGFDELNLLTDALTKSKAGKTVPDYASMFEEVPIENASEGVQKIAEKIKAITEKVSSALEKVRDFMARLGIDFDDVLKVVGLIGAGLLAWKFAAPFVKTLGDLLGVLAFGASLVISVAGFAVEFEGMKALGRGEVTKENILKAVGGALAGIAGLTLAFGTTGLVIGLVASVGIAIAGLTIGRKQAMWETELGQHLRQLKDEIEKNHAFAIEIQTEINVHREDVAKKIRDIETEFDGLRAMLDEIFRLDAIDNKTAIELDTLKRLAKELNDYGIEIHIDEAGHVVETRQELEKLIDKTEAYYKLQAYQEGLIQAYKDQAKAEKALHDQQQTLNDATATYNKQLSVVRGLLTETEKKTMEAYGSYGAYGAIIYQIGKNYKIWDTEVNTNLGLLVEAEQAYRKQKEAVGILETAVEDVTADIEYYSGKIDEANKQDLKVKTDDTALDGTIGKLNRLPDLMNGANSLTIRPRVDDSAISELENRIAALGTTSKNIAQRTGNGPKISAYASGGFPETGEMFIAREAGPELVGEIGRRTGVANNGQIVNGISAGVAEANEGIISALYAAAQQIIQTVRDKDTSVSIDGRKLSREVTNQQNRMNRMHGASLQNA